MRITICGGGSLGHVCLGVLGSRKDVDVCLLTRHPERWNDEIIVNDGAKEYKGIISMKSSNPADVIPDADIVLLCLPGFAIKDTLHSLKPFLSTHTAVGSIVSSTGFFFFAHEEMPHQPLFGFQRVPFIARTTEYGHRANLLGYKPSLNIATENISDAECFRGTIETMFNTPIHLLGSFYEAALTNSNPILHTGRLYSMWNDWHGEGIDHCTLFYKEWTIDAATWLIDMDKEFMSLLDVLPMNADAIPSLLEYYESHDADSLARKLRSIKAFESIEAPMVQREDGLWIPDFNSRYFTEDFPYGLHFIVELAHKNNIPIPKMETVYYWGMGKIN